MQQQNVSTSSLTPSLKERVNVLLKNRGSMAVEEVKLLEEVLRNLEEQERVDQQPQPVSKKNKWEKAGNILYILMRFLSNPHISEGLHKLVLELIDKLS